jgi:poly-gamma-glutamate synthase PgsB/CapB
MLFKIVISSLVIYLFILFLEKHLYDKRINKLLIRILVNGTRGKSSVTEYITGALRASAKNTLGKITGIVPTIILNNGIKKRIRRFNGARVQEQIKVVRFAASQKAEALVLECMSIQPDLQQLESRIFKPHIYVLTNILNDHQEEMGLSEEEQAESICSAIPASSIVVTNEKRFLGMIKSFAEKKKSIVHTCEGITSSFIQLESVVDENIRIALKVCSLLKLDMNLSEKAMRRIQEDKTPLNKEYLSGDKKITFINGFAVNDVPSAEVFVNSFEKKMGVFENPIYIFNSRSDRPYRTAEFAKWFSGLKNISSIYLIGSHSIKAKKEMVRRGMDKSKLKILKHNEIKNLLDDIDNSDCKEVTLIGIGNIAVDGFSVIKQFIPENILESVRL